MFDQSTVHFLRAEIRTGLTFLHVAQSATRSDKINRNRANARKAYDCATHFLPAATLSADEIQEIKAGLEELRFELQSLGETF